MSELQLLAMAYAGFLALIAVEFLWSWLRADGGYRLEEFIVNIGHGILYQVWDSFTKVLFMVPFMMVAAWVPWSTLPLDAPWAWLLAVVLFDFSTYWAHRHHHEINILWAIHSAHHAAEDFNLAAALRQPLLQNTFKWLWRLPLALVLPVEMFVGAVVFDYLYQFLQHTRYVGRLGPLEWVLNTPSHHRVHHGRQEAYLDKNYGGILIIWDRMFGTFEPEVEEADVGLTQPLGTYNALWANLEIWARLVRATGRAQGWNKLRVWFVGPAELHRVAPGGPSYPPQELDSMRLRPVMRLYVAAAGMPIPLLLAWSILGGETWSLAARVAVALAIVLGVVALGGLLEEKAWARWLESTRWVLTGAVGAVLLQLPWLLLPGLLVAAVVHVLGREPQRRPASEGELPLGGPASVTRA